MDHHSTLSDYLHIGATTLGILIFVFLVPWAFVWQLAWPQLVASGLAIALLIWGESD